jgi:hypothetical protein
MNKSSVKAARRSSKATRRTGKKAAKSARATSKKAVPSSRRSAGASKTRALNIRSVQKVAPMLRTVSPPTQPQTIELPVKNHKYVVGDTVYYNSPSFGRAAATGSYTVIKLLPSEGDDYQYRIKSSGEAFERVAKESQLDRA